MEGVGQIPWELYWEQQRRAYFDSLVAPIKPSDEIDSGNSLDGYEASSGSAFEDEDSSPLVVSRGHTPEIELEEPIDRRRRIRTPSNLRIAVIHLMDRCPKKASTQDLFERALAWQDEADAKAGNELIILSPAHMSRLKSRIDDTKRGIIGYPHSVPNHRDLGRDWSTEKIAQEIFQLVSDKDPDPATNRFLPRGGPRPSFVRTEDECASPLPKRRRITKESSNALEGGER